MKKCIKCRQQIPDSCDVCTYCGQWQTPENETHEKDVIKTTKACVKCKQQIPIDCEECIYCGQPQPKNEKDDKDCTYNSYYVEEDYRKKRGKIAVIILAVCIPLFASIIALVTMPSFEQKSFSKVNQESETEPAPVDNSVNGKGYYYFENAFDDSIVEKFMSVYDTDGGLATLGLDVTIDKFSYEEDYTLLEEERVSQYSYFEVNGKNGVFMLVNDDNEVVAFSYIFLPSMIEDITTTDEYKYKQLCEKPADWLYALNDTLTFDEAIDIYSTLFNEFLSNYIEKAVRVAYYYKGYTMINQSTDTQWCFTIMKTDSDFIERNNIENGETSIFQPINTDDSSSANNEIEEETSNLEPVAASDTEIAEAEDLLRKETFGSDYLGFEDKLNVLDAIYFYFDDLTLEATKYYNGNIILKFTGIEKTFNETQYITYEVNTKNGYVNFIESSFNWEAFKEFYPSDLYNDYVHNQ